MGTLFIPPETKGMWDAVSQTLTVFVGEEAFIGFQGSAQELQNARFSMSDYAANSPPLEVSRDGQSRLQLRIDTTRPRRLVFSVNDGDGRSLTPTITLLVSMRPDYSGLPAMGQQDTSACWAASLAWWLKATPGRTPVSQMDLINRGAKVWNEDGTINPAALDRFVHDNGYGMTTRQILPAELPSVMGFWPVMIGFRAPGGFGHMNVLYGQSAAGGPVDAMEPWFPDPDYDLRYTYDDTAGTTGPRPYYDRRTGLPFQFTGTKVKTAFERYSRRPMSTGRLWIGFPSEYSARM